MIPTRTNLLQLKDKARSLTGSVGILKARRLALMQEFLSMSAPFLRSRDEIRSAYAQALIEMQLALGHQGEYFITSLEQVSGRDLGVEITEQSVMGLRYRDVSIREEPVRAADQRGYDYRATSPHLEEAIHLFERILEEMLEVAAFESKIKRLGEEIVRVNRRTRVLEERVLPALQKEVRTIAQYIGERDRESYFRLKRFKEIIAGR